MLENIFNKNYFNFYCNQQKIKFIFDFSETKCYILIIQLIKYFNKFELLIKL